MKLFPTVGHPARTNLMRLGAFAWAALISAVTFANLSNLHALSQHSGANASSADVSALETRVAELAQQVEVIRKQPPSLQQSRFDTAQKALENRLISIEQALGERVEESELSPLRDRLEKIETRLESFQPPTRPTPNRTRTSKAKAAVTALPFTVAGLELRGGEPFLSITPASVMPAAPMDVLHPGETLAGWQLDAIEGRTAILRRGAQVRRVAVP